jgi:uncharacterized iron-regulated membrane protein
MRSLTVHLHRWAGLATALFLAVAGLTGTLLAFKNELEATLNPALFSVAPPSGRAEGDMLDPFILREQLQRLHPEARADHMSFPAAGKSVMFYLMPRTDPSSGQAYPLEHDQIFVDPYSGDVLGQRRWGELFAAGRFNRENIIPFVWRLHEALALPHPWGKLFMGVIALIWTIDCFIGLYLTFPRVRPFLQKWRPAWQIKRGASAYRLNLDVHRAAGLWLWIVLLVFAWSSVMLNLKEIVYQPVMSLAFEFRNERPPRLPEPRWTPALDWRQAHGMAQKALQSLAQQQGFEVEAEDSLWYRPAQGAYMYRARTSLDIRDEGGGTELWIDGDSGKLLKAQQEGRAASGDTLSTWLRFLHTGQVFGITYRIAVGIVGVFVAILSVTGVVIWWVKRKSRKASARRA